MSERDSQEQFVETLQKVVEKARSNKDTIGMDEISRAFEGLDLPVEQMEEIYEYIRAQNIIVTQGRMPEDDLDAGVAGEDTDDILIDTDDDLLDGEDPDDVEDLDDVEEVRIEETAEVLEGVSTEDPVRMYL